MVTLDRKTICEFEFRVNQSEVYLGSHQKADVELEGTKVSPFHAKVFCRNGQFQLEDLGSERGTYLDGKKVAPGGTLALHDGASVRIVAYQIRFDLHENRRVAALSDNRSKTKKELRPYQPQLRSGCVEDKTIGAASSKLRTASQTVDQWSKGTTELVVADVIDETYDVKTYVDITTQIERQASFLSMLFGNQDYQYSAYDLREAHSHLVKDGLNDSHFDRLVEHLNSSLKELEVPGHEIDGIMEMLESMRDDVLCR